ncbi:hypothetical protein SDC9_174569 [bioreactor metagenome]|uniref:Uncharacterized protein n=1 Tax=bioreactor metagenome TaxID=1076179 RepID=A0A645GMP2_9ZZZZ
MDLETLFSRINPDIVIFLVTTLLAFISWLIKGLVEKPIIESKNTFNKFLEKRIEVLTEIKVRLNFIAYFPNKDDSEEYKNQLQEIILKDGKAGYLNKDTFDAVLKISITPVTDEKLLFDTIKAIDQDLFSQISKIYDEVNFYRKFSNYNPFKRFLGFLLLSIQYALSFVLISSILILLIYCIIYNYPRNLDNSNH